jgi:site-specific DNA-adenine methylase
MKDRITSDIIVMTKSFVDIDYSDFDENDLLYFDPPYLNSVGNYNDGKRGFEGWTEEHEKKLLKLLDNLNSQGTRFALSNNLKYENPYLENWKNKYKIHYLDGDYVNCNYHKIDKSKDSEVLITNY